MCGDAHTLVSQTRRRCVSYLPCLVSPPLPLPPSCFFFPSWLTSPRLPQPASSSQGYHPPPHAWSEVPRASSKSTVLQPRTSGVELELPQPQTTSPSSLGGHFPPEGHRGPQAHLPHFRTLSLWASTFPSAKGCQGPIFLHTLAAPNKILISQRGVTPGKLSHIVKRKLQERGAQMTHTQKDEGLGWLVL